jgi:hypothetical protein
MIQDRYHLHTKETYEYWVHLQRHPSTYDQKASETTDFETEYLFKLEYSLDTAEKVRDATSLSHVSRVYPATYDDDLDSTFVIITGVDKQKITSQYGLKSTFIRLSEARKNLCPFASYPKVGMEGTLPQFRPDKLDIIIKLQQDEHPVCDFLYVTSSVAPWANRVVSHAYLVLTLNLDWSDHTLLVQRWIHGQASARPW